ncbi:MAG: hypothetical protein ABI551_09900, partial [Polyangiaceae bacterium]
CRDSDGNTSTCTPTSDDLNQDGKCCVDRSGPVRHVSLSFAASSCPNMCSWAAGLSVDYCNQYFGGP